MKLAMTLWSPAAEESEMQRVRDIREQRSRDENTERRSRLFRSAIQGFRKTFVLMALLASMTALFYHRYQLHQVASTTGGAMASKIRQVGANSGIRQIVVNEERAVDQAGSQGPAKD